LSRKIHIAGGVPRSHCVSSMGEAMEEDDHFDRGTSAVALDQEYA
jgi:hypothetical protein